MVKEIIDMIKRGFEIAFFELIFFFPRVYSCIILVGLPFFFSAIIPTLLIGALLLLKISIPAVVFKIFLTVSLIPAICASMALIDDQEAKENSSTNELKPSKDLIIALYVLIAISIWKFI